MKLIKLRQRVKKRLKYILFITGTVSMLLFSVACDKSNEDEKDILENSGIEQGLEDQVTETLEDIGEINQTDQKSLEDEDNITSSYDDLTVSIKEDSVTASGLTLVFHNSGDKEYHYGSYYHLDRKEDSSWVRLPYEYDGEGEIGWTEEAYPVMKDTDSIWEVNWEWLYSKLTAGEYRIVKNGNDFRKTGDFDSFMVGVTFEIK